MHTQTTPHAGRLCNQIIRNLCVSCIAKKYDLFVEYSSYNIIRSMGIPLYIGRKSYDQTIVMKNEHFFEYLNATTEINANIDANHDYFQNDQIAQFLYSHLQDHKNIIAEYNKYKIRYKNNNDIFVHVRLGDIYENGWNPSIEYYQTAIDLVKTEIEKNSPESKEPKIYIGTDDPASPFIKELLKKNPKAEVLSKSPEETIMFGSTCKNVILSHGSFSAVIGWLSFYSGVYYPKYERAKVKWFGDTFSIKGWRSV